MPTDIERALEWIKQRREDIAQAQSLEGDQLREWVTGGLPHWDAGLHVIGKMLEELDTLRAQKAAALARRAASQGTGDAQPAQQPTPGGQMYVSAPAALGMLVAGAAVGAAGGYFGRGYLDKRKGSTARELPE